MLIGHQRIWNFLTQSAANNRLSHAYLFVGPSEVGKKKVALEFVKLLECEKPEITKDGIISCGECRSCLLIEKNQHPDVLLIEPVSQPDETQPERRVKNQEIKIGQIRQIQHQVSLSPFSAKYKVIIIDSAEQMTLEAANCLLKTLEEPPQKSILILLSSNWQKLLPTIISRCQLIKFLPVRHNLIEEGLRDSGFKDKAKIEQVQRYACGRPGVAIKLISQIDLWNKKNKSIDELQNLVKKDLVIKFKYAKDLSQNSPEAQNILNDWLIWFRDQMLSIIGVKNLMIFGSQGASGDYSLMRICKSIKDIQQAQGLLNESSFNSRLILENLLLKI